MYRQGKRPPFAAVAGLSASSDVLRRNAFQLRLWTQRRGIQSKPSAFLKGSFQRMKTDKWSQDCTDDCFLTVSLGTIPAITERVNGREETIDCSPSPSSSPLRAFAFGRWGVCVICAHNHTRMQSGCSTNVKFTLNCWQIAIGMEPKLWKVLAQSCWTPGGLRGLLSSGNQQRN